MALVKGHASFVGEFGVTSDTDFEESTSFITLLYDLPFFFCIAIMKYSMWIDLLYTKFVNKISPSFILQPVFSSMLSTTCV